MIARVNSLQVGENKIAYNTSPLEWPRLVMLVLYKCYIIITIITIIIIIILHMHCAVYNVLLPSIQESKR